MYNILTLNKIAKCGLDKLDPDQYIISDTCEAPDGIILRSFSMHDMELPLSLKAIARAGAGVNNIPIDSCTEKGIVVFNTPGANANAVKELSITALLLSSRDIVGGINWTKTLEGNNEANKLVEKGKSNYAGPEIKGKKLGVVGLGAIGVMVANTASSLGMDVAGFDPYLSCESEQQLSDHVKRVNNINELVSTCDYISIHVPQNDSTKGMFNRELFSIMKKGVRIINLSRDGLVNNTDIKEAIESGIVACYVTDFPTVETIGIDKVICIPHLGASTPESEDNCAEMAAREIDAFLRDGNIVNSVNFPNCELKREGKCRITILHKSDLDIGEIVSIITGECGTEIRNMISKSKANNAYTIIDCNDDVAISAITKLELTAGVLGVRKI